MNKAALTCTFLSTFQASLDLPNFKSGLTASVTRRESVLPYMCIRFSRTMITINTMFTSPFDMYMYSSIVPIVSIPVSLYTYILLLFQWFMSEKRI